MTNQTNDKTMQRLREGNIPSSKLNAQKIALWVGGGLTLTLALVGYTYWLIQSQQSKNSLPDDTAEFRQNSPDFFSGAIVKTRTEPKYISDFPTTRDTQPPVESEPPLSADKAFKSKQVQQEPAQPQISEARLNALRYRQANAVAGFTRSVPATTSNKAIDTKADKEQVKMIDDDFGADVEKDISSLPVDLTRTITADRAIPCILNDQIHSQIAGVVTCQVENNIYGFHGRKILIPAGSKAIGYYQPIEKTGMSRFALQWKRLLRPDGVHIALTEAYASDQIGQAGVTGKVDNRFFDKYGAAIITASLSTIAQVSMNSRVEENSASQAVYENFGTDLGKVTASMLEEVVNIKPFAVVPSGTRLFIRPQTDIWLRKTSDNQLVFGVTNNKEDKA